MTSQFAYLQFLIVNGKFLNVTLEFKKKEFCKINKLIASVRDKLAIDTAIIEPSCAEKANESTNAHFTEHA